MDRATYDRQRERVRVDEADRFEKLRGAEAVIDETYLVTAERVLELARNARPLWERRSDEKSPMCSRSWFVTQASGSCSGSADFDAARGEGGAASPVRFELTTAALGKQSSIQLSYGDVVP